MKQLTQVKTEENDKKQGNKKSLLYQRLRYTTIINKIVWDLSRNRQTDKQKHNRSELKYMNLIYDKIYDKKRLAKHLKKRKLLVHILQ